MATLNLFDSFKKKIYAVILFYGEIVSCCCAMSEKKQDPIKPSSQDPPSDSGGKNDVPAEGTLHDIGDRLADILQNITRIADHLTAPKVTPLPHRLWANTRALFLILPSIVVTAAIGVILFAVFEQSSKSNLVIGSVHISKSSKSIVMSEKMLAAAIKDDLHHMLADLSNSRIIANKLSTPRKFLERNFGPQRIIDVAKNFGPARIENTILKSAQKDISIPGTGTSVQQLADIFRDFLGYADEKLNIYIIEQNKNYRIEIFHTKEKSIRKMQLITIKKNKYRDIPRAIAYEIISDRSPLYGSLWHLKECGKNSQADQIETICNYRRADSLIDRYIETIQRTERDGSAKKIVAAEVIRALILIRKDKIQLANNALQRAIQISYKNEGKRILIAHKYYLKGMRAFSEAKYESAIENLEKAIEKDSSFSAAHLAMGNSHLKLGQFNKAIKVFKKTAKIDRENSVVFINWGYSLANKNPASLHNAIEKYKTAIGLDPKNATAYAHWGDALRRMKKFPESIDKYTRAIQYRSKFYVALNNLSYVLIQSNRLDEAEGYLTKILEEKDIFDKIGKNLAYVRKNIGLVYNGKGNYSDAIYHLNFALALNSDLAEAHKALGDAYWNQGDIEKATQSYETAMALDFQKYGRLSEQISGARGP